MCTKRGLWFPFKRSKCQRRKNKSSNTYSIEASIFNKRKDKGTASTQIKRRCDGQKQREEITKQDPIRGMHTRGTIGKFEYVYHFFSQPKLELQKNR